MSKPDQPSATPAGSPRQPALPYIICVDLNDQWVCVVGGGKVAARKVESLLEAGAKVHIIAHDLCDDLANCLADPACQDRLVWHRESYHRNLPPGIRLAVACTDNREVNRQVRNDCRTANVLCNVVDDPELCDFILPAVRRLGRVQIAVSTAGSSPSMARGLADYLAGQVDPTVPELAQLLAEIRLEVQTQIPDTAKRKELYGTLCSEQSLNTLKKSSKDGWRQWYQQQLARLRG